jgi:hypothetical protein
VVLDFDTRAKDFLKRLTPLSADLAAHGGTRTLALQKLHRICQAEVRTLKARYTLATVKLALSKYRNAIRAVEPDHLVLRPRKMRSGQRFSYLALEPEETRALERRLPPAHSPRPVPSHPARVRRFSSKRLSNSWPATATSKKAWAWMALTGRRPAEIFISAKFSSLGKHSPILPHLRWPTQNP